jgi:hypothetical protein
MRHRALSARAHRDQALNQETDKNRMASAMKLASDKKFHTLKGGSVRKRKHTARSRSRMSMDSAGSNRTTKKTTILVEKLGIKRGDLRQ